MKHKLKDFHGAPVQQPESWTCGMYSVAFAVQAKAGMREMLWNFNPNRIIDIWKQKKQEGMGFLLPLKKSLNVFENEDIGDKLSICNIQQIDAGIKNIKNCIDNLVTPILAISFSSRKMEEGVQVYSSKDVGASKKSHIVCAIDYTEDYLILRDSNGGKYNRIYFKDSGIIDQVCTFNICEFKPKFISPVEEIYITQKFGENKEYYSQFKGQWIEGHLGLDYRTRTKKNPDGIGTRILASHKGIVKNFSNTTYGKYIEIEDFDSGGIITRYCHLSEHKKKDSSIVQQGEVIGLSGNTGNSQAPHLHFEIEIDGKRVDPEIFIS